jgi:glutathione S-transferase
LSFRGENVWSSFMEYLADSAKDRQQLNKELNALENSVGDSMPYVGGKNPCAWDAAIAPRVYLARIGCKTLTQWDFAEEFPNIKAYLHRWMGRSSWRNTASWDEESIADDLRPKMK